MINDSRFQTFYSSIYNSETRYDRKKRDLSISVFVLARRSAGVYPSGTLSHAIEFTFSRPDCCAKSLLCFLLATKQLLRGWLILCTPDRFFYRYVEAVSLACGAMTD